MDVCNLKAYVVYLLCFFLKRKNKQDEQYK